MRPHPSRRRRDGVPTHATRGIVRGLRSESPSGTRLQTVTPMGAAPASEKAEEWRLKADVLDVLAKLVAERLAGRSDLPRLTLTKRDAARALGVSVDHLERHVL